MCQTKEERQYKTSRPIERNQRARTTTSSTSSVRVYLNTTRRHHPIGNLGVFYTSQVRTVIIYSQIYVLNKPHVTLIYKMLLSQEHVSELWCLACTLLFGLSWVGGKEAMNLGIGE